MDLFDVKCWLKLTTYFASVRCLLSLTQVPAEHVHKTNLKARALFEADAITIELDSFTEFTASTRLQDIFQAVNLLHTAEELLTAAAEDLSGPSTLFESKSTQ